MSKIVVPGGGVGGLSMVLMLAKEGLDVTVLERDSGPVAPYVLDEHEEHQPKEHDRAAVRNARRGRMVGGVYIGVR